MQITLWEHCASAAFSLNAFWGLLVTPVGHAVSPDVRPPSPVLVLSPTWEHKWQAAFKQAMLHLWNLSSRWFLMSCYCLISWGVAWLEPCALSLICSCFQLWDKRGSWRAARPGWLSLGRLEMSSCCWAVLRWGAGSVGQSRGAVVSQNPFHTRQGSEPRAASDPPHGTGPGSCVHEMVWEVLGRSYLS